MKPVPKARAKLARSKYCSTCPYGKVHSYTPNKTATAEAEIWNTCIDQSMGRKFQPICWPKPARVEATFFISRPKSVSKKITKPVKKPDLSNYFKLLEDALGNLPWDNDSQITTCLIMKRYSDEPRIEVKIDEDVE